MMVLVWIGIAVGVLTVLTLIVKVLKTPSREVAGIDVYCRKCGRESRGLTCPNCEKKPMSFDV